MRFQKRPGLEAIIGRTPEVQRELFKRATAAQAAARAIAPVETGAYRNGIVAESGIEGPTAKARLNAKDFKSAWLEVGTSRMSARAVLRRACDAVGLRLGGP